MGTHSLKLGGVYKHYKGKMYKVHQIVRHSESLEELVCYECLYPNDLGIWWVRPVELFQGTVEIDGVVQERFQLME